MLPLPCPAFSKLMVPHDGKKVHARMLAASYFVQTDDERKQAGLDQYIALTWPEFTTEISPAPNGFARAKWSNSFNPWLKRMLRAFTNHTHVVKRGNSVFRFIGLTGCASASKSHCASLYAVAWWSCSPHNSIAILCSTTVGMIRHRIWPVVTHYATGGVDFSTGEPLDFGHLIDSQLEFRAHKHDAKHAIFALAVAHGETQKALHNLKGMHAERMLLVVDEANGTPEAIFEAIGNLRTGARDVTVIIIGNPCSRLDPHGRAIAPAQGWQVAADDKVIEWPSKGVPEWELEPGLVLRFDGRDSPNVVAGEDRWPYLYTTGDWQQACELFEKTGGNFSYWTQKRGLHPPEGFAFTIFNEQLLTRCDALDSVFTFDSSREKLAFLDPAFTSGGDSCILQFGELGDVNGRKCLQYTDWLEVPIDPTAASHDIDYQIARRVQQECVVRGIKPHQFALDGTGVGRGCAAVMAAEWSPAIHITQWGLGATDRPSAQNDGRPAREVYRDFVTEMWFALRESTEAGQAKGFSQEALVQLCSRTWDMGKKQHAKKYALEPKSDYKLRMRFSPDNADACVGLMELARRNGLEIAGKVATMITSQWTTQLKEAQTESVLSVDAGMIKSDGDGWGEAA